MSDIISYIQDSLQYYTSSSISKSPKLSLKGAIPHPYYPLGIAIAGYTPNTHTIPYLLATFAATCTVVLGSTALIAKRVRPSMKQSELWTLLWFMLSGCIHLFFEGFYSLNYKDIGAQNNIFAQLWKEYSMSDSRYLTQDAFVLIMESITAFTWGPICLALVYMITTQSPFRHPFQLIVSLGQLYGDVLYYGTSLFDAFFYARHYSHPHPYYFWCYYVFMNLFWIFIPFGLMVSSINEMASCARFTASAQKPLKALEGKALNGDVKKAKGRGANGTANGHSK